MDYDKIILEMLSRIQNLEEQVKELQKSKDDFDSEENSKEPPVEKITTADIRNFIEQRKNEAKQDGKSSLTLRASEIHCAMGLRKRYPMVCNAMRQCMGPHDTFVHKTASGYSSSLEIQYELISQSN